MAREVSLITHVRDSKGNVYQEDLYRLRIFNGIQIYERPPKSGNYSFFNGDACDENGVPLKAEAPVAEAPKPSQPFHKKG